MTSMFSSQSPTNVSWASAFDGRTMMAKTSATSAPKMRFMFDSDSVMRKNLDLLLLLDHDRVPEHQDLGR